MEIKDMNLRECKKFIDDCGWEWHVNTQDYSFDVLWVLPKNRYDIVNNSGIRIDGNALITRKHFRQACAALELR